MDSCFVGGRLNKGQILAEVEHRLSHKRNSGYEMDFKKIRWPLFEKVDSLDCNALNCDAMGLLAGKHWDKYIKPDVIYMDPPYGGQQSDYGCMYSFFESYLVQQMPSNWNHIKDTSLNAFVNSKNYEDNFISLLELACDIPCLVISYNDSSWADIDYLVSVIGRYRDCEVHNLDYEYKYRDSANKTGLEYLIVAR